MVHFKGKLNKTMISTKSISIKFLIIGLILAINLIFLPKLQAEPLETFMLTSLTITPLENTAKIVWTTNYSSWGRIKYGPTTDLGSWVENTTPSLNHEMWLSGMTVNKKYYFIIEAYDIYGRPFTSSIYEFTTQKENDITPPILSNVHTSFVTGNTATFVWYTNELANTCVYYGIAMSNLNQSKCVGGWSVVHDITITNLTRNTTYYYRAYSKDKSNNGAFSVYYTYQTNMVNDINIPYLKIYQTTYTAENETTVSISFLTSRPVEGKLKWGTESGKHNHQINLPPPRSTNNQIVISGLKPSETYYYYLDIKDIFNHHLISPEYVFFTPNPELVASIVNSNVDYNPADPNQDFDADGLTNSQEGQYGTDPIRADSDGDGYVDGIEVVNGYNPLGPGKLTIEIPVDIFAYNKPRVNNLMTEVNSANELKYHLEQLFRKPIPVARNSWPTLVNAYLYGKYPVEAIYKAIIFSGKTVHPTIPWSAWQNSDDYQKYINK